MKTVTSAAVLSFALALCQEACMTHASSDDPNANATSQEAIAPSCDDGNMCTVDVRAKGKCRHSAVADGSACAGGTCAGGACVAPRTPTQIGTGETQSCARVASGAVYCWGVNCEGGLGTGAPADCSTPMGAAKVLNLDDAADIGVGDEHVCAVKADASVVCWGWNTAGALGDGTTTDSATPVAAVGLAGVAHVYGGRTHSCAVLQSGQVACWGDNFFGMLGDGTRTASSVPKLVAGIGDAVSAGLAEGTTCVLRRSGGIACWGWHGDWNNQSANQLTPLSVPGINDAVSIGVGHDHMCAVRASGQVQCWGNNSDGQLGTGLSGCPGGGYDCPPPGVPMVGIGDATQVTGGYVHSCVLSKSGSVLCSGWFGDDAGAFSDHLAPVAVNALAGVVGVSAGEVSNFDTCAARSDGTFACWGLNDVGQLGDSAFTGGYSAAPLTVTGIP
jgi:alpha-tubulin suppressor-like RCC1 family protein